jgi:hypothetical protein
MPLDFSKEKRKFMESIHSLIMKEVGPVRVKISPMKWAKLN